MLIQNNPHHVKILPKVPLLYYHLKNEQKQVLSSVPQCLQFVSCSSIFVNCSSMFAVCDLFLNVCSLSSFPQCLQCIYGGRVKVVGSLLDSRASTKTFRGVFDIPPHPLSCEICGVKSRTSLSTDFFLIFLFKICILCHK